MLSNKFSCLYLVAASVAQAQLLPPITLSPARIAADSNPTTVTIYGSNFASGMIAEWNHQPRPTVFVNSNKLQVVLSVEDLALPSLSRISVWDASGANQLTADTGVLVYLGILNNALAYDSSRGVIYVATSAKQKPNGQSIGVLDPNSTLFTSWHPLDAEPLRLAISDDCQFLYIAMPNKIERITLATWSVDLAIPITAGVLSMAVVPGQAHSLVVSFSSGGSPPYASTAVFDDAQERPNKVTKFEGPSYLLGGPSSDTMYGYDGSTYILGLNSAGVSVTSSFLLCSGGSAIPVYSDGLLYMWDCAVDPTVPQVKQTFGIGGIPSPIASGGKVLILNYGSVLSIADYGDFLALVDVNTGARIWTQPIPALPAYANGVMNDPIITWGANGVAFRDGTGDYSNLNAPAIQLFRVNTSDTAAGAFIDEPSPRLVHRVRPK